MLYNGSVFPLQHHHIRHGTDGRQIPAEIQQQLRLAAVQRGTQLEGHTRAGKGLAGACVVRPGGVHHRHRLRQCFTGQVVVGNHQVHAQLLGAPGLLDGGDAVIHRDDELIALFGQLFHNGVGQAVAILLAAGQLAAHIGAHATQMGI